MPEKRYDYVNTSDVLRHAIEDNTISVLYQPIFDVNTKRITSLDTIVRVHDAQGCTLAPRIRKLLRSRICRWISCDNDAFHVVFDDVETLDQVEFIRSIGGKLSKEDSRLPHDCFIS